MLCVELCVLDGPDEIIVVVRIIELADEISSVEEIDDEVVKIVFVPRLDEPKFEEVDEAALVVGNAYVDVEILLIDDSLLNVEDCALLVLALVLDPIRVLDEVVSIPELGLVTSGVDDVVYAFSLEVDMLKVSGEEEYEFELGVGVEFAVDDLLEEEVELAVVVLETKLEMEVEVGAIVLLEEVVLEIAVEIELVVLETIVEVGDVAENPKELVVLEETVLEATALDAEFVLLEVVVLGTTLEVGEVFEMAAEVKVLKVDELDELGKIEVVDRAALKVVELEVLDMAALNVVVLVLEGLELELKLELDVDVIELDVLVLDGLELEAVELELAELVVIELEVVVVDTAAKDMVELDVLVLEEVELELELDVLVLVLVLVLKELELDVLEIVVVMVDELEELEELVVDGSTQLYVDEIAMLLGITSELVSIEAGPQTSWAKLPIAGPASNR